MTKDSEEIRHTGIWPFNLFPPMGKPDPASPTVKIFDPVALAFNAGGRLIEAGWGGLELMPTAFLWKIVDAKPDDVGVLVSEWVNEHQAAIADVFEERLSDYTFDELAKTAMCQALDAYRRSHFLATVRTLMPEFERFGRMVVQADGSLPGTQKESVKAIQGYLGDLPAGHYPPIESLSTYHMISKDLFARCLNQEDAQNLGAGPNRHAEVHGLASYGNLQGATKMLSAADFMLSAVNLAIAQNEDTKSAVGNN
jgi:hypothetical protein